ncbi:SHOCT domain-containing protein [Actinomadura luteofluorescens]|uniref:SHOCT domain-containing protein n=1 Tax=Actinomadura luteofluorescens TaxID=46163 RepID=UPI003D920C52
MMYWHGDMNAWGYALMTISMVLFWSLVIFGLVALFRYAANSAHHQEPPSSASSPSSATPEQMLAERFARGEIDAEEYQHRLETLRISRASEKGRQPSSKP